ncbi:FAD-dependent oxidoreductase [Cerasicoccus frondis]|uniref:FAD-dependent oxidoreductase n=1 Tax=Cerasicoccus frondis TaxID=490090 RepID=UPI0028527520|nr:FAD-dependent oxidoreductase [Cerasicoccus frondis]
MLKAFRQYLRSWLLILACLNPALSSTLEAAANTPNPGLKYYYPAPEAPVVDVEADIIVYGGTSGGVIAAQQAVRQGNSVALVVFGRHVGGMTSGGLTETDGVDASVQGGLTREYFDMVGNKGFKPSAAEAAFEALLSDPVPNATWDAPIPTYYEQRLESVAMEGTQIVAIHMENGSVFRGKVFIDCTYEGDLMAMAGVPYTYGRESRDAYGEYLAGRRSSVAISGVDAYKTPGEPESGLIYNLIQDEAEGVAGQADDHVQAYNFRMFTTWSDKLPLWEPAGYNPDDFQLLYRYHKNGGSTRISVGNDINNHEMFNRGVSTDHIGGNRWPDGNGGYIPWWEADYETRELIFQSHVNWQLGMLWYVKTDPDYAALTNDPSVDPAQQDAIRGAINTANAIGLPNGEYPETNGWPHELYVREARRMVSDFVTTQAHYDRLAPVSDPVGLANYRADAHHSRRFAAADGAVRVEGDTGGHNHTPWPIAYRSLTPPADSVTNLLVPWCISASHVAFCSMRMEPCFMVLSQSASTAAGIAIKEEKSVQDISYDTLRLRLYADGQLLGELPTASNEIIVDNLETEHVTLTGSWTTSSSTPGFYGGNYFHDDDAHTGKSASFRPSLPATDTYDVYLRWTAFANRATNAPVRVTHANGNVDLLVNQQENGGEWVLLGTWSFNAGTDGAITVSNEDANGYVIVDAVRLVQHIESSIPTVHVMTANPYAWEDSAKPARIQVLREGDSYASPLNVAITVSGSAIAGEHYQALPTQVIIPANHKSVDVWIVPLSDDLPQGSRQVIVSLTSSTDYTIGVNDEAEISILDKPADHWRHQNFSPVNDHHSPESGPDADPDNDGRSNLLERYFDSDPINGSSLLESAPRIITERINNQRWCGLIWSRSGQANDLNAHVEYQHSSLSNEWIPLPTAIETLHWAQATGARTLRQWMAIDDFESVFFRIAVE